jgi:DNA sulfur modification protein DndB
MAMVIAAVRGKMGSTEYYQVKMPARELVSSIRPAGELDEWATWGIEERMQREINQTRITKEMIPYVTKSKDRFFGSLIVLVFRGEVYFEPLTETSVKVPHAYRKVASDIGFLTIEGGQLVALDGQHRLVTLRDIIQGKVADGECVSEVPGDEISVIFIKHESNEKTRRIFNKVNRYAKPTGRGDNVITSEDDGYAIVTRRLLDEGEPLGGKDSRGDLIVEWKNNTLSTRSAKLTTISAVYESVKELLSHENIKEFDEKHRVNRPSDEELDDAYEKVCRVWKMAVERLTPFRLAIADRGNIAKMREDNLLLKPAAQIALFKGIVKARQKGLTLEETFKRADKVDWHIKSDMWRDIIVRGDGAIIAGSKEAYERTADLICYLVAADRMTGEEKEHLKVAYNTVRGFDYENHDEDVEPEELPTPVVTEKKSDLLRAGT